jgi:succinyl-CoA synthetase beta subunit
VQAVFINIFGGILRVDTLAQGVVEAAKKTNVQVPVILRLEGTNVEQGREILKNSGSTSLSARPCRTRRPRWSQAPKKKPQKSEATGIWSNLCLC